MTEDRFAHVRQLFQLLFGRVRRLSLRVIRVRVRGTIIGNTGRRNAGLLLLVTRLAPSRIVRLLRGGGLLLPVLRNV